MTYENEVFTLSVKEFNQLQEQIVKLKTENFELRNAKSSAPPPPPAEKTPTPQTNKDNEEKQRLGEIVTKLRKINIRLQSEGREWKKQATILGEQLEKEKNLKLQIQKDSKVNLETLRSDLSLSWKRKMDVEIENLKKQISEQKSSHKLELKRMKQLQKETESRSKMSQKEIEKSTQEIHEKHRLETRKLEAKIKYQRGEYEKVLNELKEKYKSELKKLDSKNKHHQKDYDRSLLDTKDRYENKLIQKDKEYEKLLHESNERIRNEQKVQESLLKQQQVKFEKKLVEHREKWNLERKNIETKYRNLQKEDEKKILFFKKKKNMHKQKKNDARFQVKELNKIVQKIRKESKEKDTEINVLRKKLFELDSLRGELRREREKLSKSKSALEREKKDVVLLSRKLKAAKRLELKIRKESEDLRVRLQRRIRGLSREIDRLSKGHMHHFVKDILRDMIVKDESEEKRKYLSLYKDTKHQFDEYQSKTREVESQVESLQVALEDSRIESEISQKSNKQLIRELKSHLKVQKTEFMKKYSHLEKEKRELFSKLDSYQQESDHSTKSASSAHSTPSVKRGQAATPSVNRKVPGSSPAPPMSQLKKDNAELLRRMTGFQKKNWMLEDRIKLMQNKMFEKEEEIDKKKKVIHNYMLRERLGRLSPMQERKHKVGVGEEDASLGIIRGLFSKKKKTTNVSAQLGFTRMHKVLEETILKNIQLHDNMKIMGEEVARLMEENKKMKSELDNRKLNSMK